MSYAPSWWLTPINRTAVRLLHAPDQTGRCCEFLCRLSFVDNLTWQTQGVKKFFPGIFNACKNLRPKTALRDHAPVIRTFGIDRQSIKKALKFKRVHTK
jgi:hypothetical protein